VRARTFFVQQRVGRPRIAAARYADYRACSTGRGGFGVAGDRSIATEDTMADEEVIVLRKYSSEVEATMAHLVLEAHNIPSAVMRDNAGGMIPSISLLYPVRLAVRREDADEARRILDAEAPLESEDGGEEVVDEPQGRGTSWSPESDQDDEHLLDDSDDPEADRRW
jgi:hypothetical protein